MYKVSELVGKPLVLLKNARFLGTISSVFFDNKLKTAKCISVIDEDFNTFFLSINSISCLDFDVAICKNLFFVNAKKSACDNSTLNKQNDCVCESNLPIEQNFCQKTTTLCAKSDFETKVKKIELELNKKIKPYPHFNIFFHSFIPSLQL